MSIRSFVTRGSWVPNAREEDEEYLSNRAQRFLFSSSLVRDACVSRLDINYKRDLVSLKMYEKFYSKPRLWLYYFLVLVNLCTILFEYPSTFLIKKVHQPPYQIAVTLNIVCIIYFYYRWIMINAMSEKEKSMQNAAMKLTLVILVLMTIDIIVFIICQHVPSAKPVQWSRPLRPLLLLTFPENRRLRVAFGNLYQTTLDIMPIISLIMAVVTLLSIVSNTLLAGKLVYPNGEPYFSGILDIIWEFYVLTTTSNSPSAILPAYEHDRMYIMLYIIASVLCKILFMSILFACVYNSYKAHLGESVVSAVAKRKKKLDEAFHLVCTHTPSGDLGISQGTFLRLLRLAKPKRTEDTLRVVFHLLNKSRSGFLNNNEFGRLAEYIRAHFIEVELSRKHFETFIPQFYELYYSPPFQLFKRIAEHEVTKWFFCSLIVANALSAILLRRYPSLQDAAEWFFTLVFLLELAMNYVLCGGVRFFEKGWNKFDTLVVFAAFIAQVLQSGLVGMGITISSGVTQIILLFRLLRLLKLLRAVPKFKTVVDCITVILPSLFIYLAILLILFYSFTCIGMEVFAFNYEPPSPPWNYTKDFSCGRIALLHTDFVKSRYCIFNFNSATESFVFLFTLAVGNNWHHLAQGLRLTSSIWIRMYFMFIHWVCKTILLNVVLAFIIEAFLLQYDTYQTQFETYVRERLIELGMDATIELEKRGIVGYTNPSFHITKEQLDSAFPPNAPATKAFILHEEPSSLEVLVFRLFEKEVEDLIQAARNSVKKASVYKTHDVYSQYKDS